VIRTVPVAWWRRTASSAGDATGAVAAPASQTTYVLVLLFATVMITGPQAYWPLLGQIRIVLLLGVLAIASCVRDFVGRKTSSRMPVESRLVLALVTCAVLSIPTSFWPKRSLDVLTDQYLKSVAIYFLVSLVLTSPRRVRAMLWVLSASCVPMALAAFSAFRSGSFMGERLAVNAGVLASNANGLALVLGLFAPFAGVLAVTADRRWMRLVAWGIVILSSVGVVLTLSRGGFIGLAWEALLFALFLRSRGRRWPIAAIALAGLLVLIMAPAEFTSRMSTSLDLQGEASAHERSQDTLYAVQYVVTHPVVGAGIGAGFLALNELRGATWTSVHNIYLTYGIDLGLPGMTIFIALFIAAYRTTKRIEHAADPARTELGAFASGVRMSLSGFAVAGMFHTVAYESFFYYAAGLAVALKTIQARQSAGEALK
jgi:hypothetical protein